MHKVVRERLDRVEGESAYTQATCRFNVAVCLMEDRYHVLLLHHVIKSSIYTTPSADVLVSPDSTKRANDVI